MANVFEIHDEELEISREDVKEAFEETVESFEDYEFKYRDYHFLELNGERKPVKKVFRNIESVRKKGEDFGFNTVEAERIFQELDFDIYNKRHHSPELFREYLQEILLDYEDAKQKPFSGDRRMYKLLNDKGPNLVTHVLEKNQISVYAGSLSVKGSAGQGNWADIPWIAILHEDETTTTQEGVYVVYLFDTEKERITLKLASGVTKLKDEVGKKEARERLQEKGEKIRTNIDIPGFNEGKVGVRNNGVGELYGPSTSFFKTYQLNEIPSPEELEDDLVTITRKYKQYIESNLEEKVTRYWMLHPGENQKYWNKWKNDDYIAIGDEKVDYSKENIDSQIEENFPEKSVSYVKSVAHKFVDEVNEGDIVLVRGNKKVLRAAKVTSGLYVEGTGDKHRKDVEWLTKEPVDISEYPDGFYNKATSRHTILEFTEKDNIKLIRDKILSERGEKPEDIYEIDRDIISNKNNSELFFEGFDITKSLHFPSNMGEDINESVRSALKSGKHIIFTGPPGTGKTKVAKNTAKFIRNNNESVDDYIFTTATADWTTFDTIGGYHPSKEKEGLLEFKSGQFLKCFREDGGEPVNKWLIIDEINRADIDKAFGQLFSVLSNDNVELPFTDDDGHTLNIISLNKGEEFDYSPSSYYVTSNWRLLATMNTYDKASLYEMSYAFMRRFAFIDVGVPTDQIGEGLISDYMAKWDGLSEPEVSEHLEELANMWKVLNQGKRSIGPAIIKDMLLFLKENSGENGLINALKLYVLPQLEGMVKQNQKELLSELANKIGYEEELARVAKQRFEVDLSDNE